MKKYYLSLFVFLFSIFNFQPSILSAQVITTVAGNGYFFGFSGDGGPATAAELNMPTGLYYDNTGDLYISDAVNQRVREVNTFGIINTIAGNGDVGFSGDGGPATAAELNNPGEMSMDNFGNIYLADVNNDRIREISNSGIINTIAGNGVTGYTGDGGPATAAEFFFVRKALPDGLGNIYIADGGNNTIRKINSSGIIKTIAGLGPFSGGYSGDGGPASAAELTNPSNLAFDVNGNLYISDSQNNRIRKINTSGIISSVAGTGFGGFSGDAGPATAAEINFPQGVILDTYGDIFITDPYSERIREIDTNGIIFTVAGDGASGYYGDGGLPTLAEIDYPVEVATDASGFVYFSDSYNNRVRLINGLNGLTIEVKSLTNLSCYGNNGAISIYAHGGKPPYTYSWSPGGQTTATVTGLSAGTYSITVTDSSHAVVTESIILTQAPVLGAYSYVGTPIACHGDLGVIYGEGFGGTSPYTYSWSPGGSTNTSITGASVGTYTLAITDANGCTASSITTLTQPAAITIIGDSLNDNGSCNGAAWLTVNGGTMPYTYKWANSNTTDSIFSQCHGSYCCVVTDAHGCKDSICVTINLFTGTNQLSVNSGQITVYPNPNNGIFIIAFSHPELVSGYQPIIEIYNVLGQKVNIGMLKQVQHDYEINLSSKPSGIYFYRVLNKDGSLIGEGKLVIQH